MIKRFTFFIAIALLLGAGSVKADEGMWLLQLMQEQHSIDLMKKQGLNLEANDLYNPMGLAIKDAVGIFGGGCTGEIISAQGLILTNHHCGYGAIQQHSSVENDYLTDGFWAYTREQELPTPGLRFTFIERIEEITERVAQDIREGKVTETESFGREYLTNLAKTLHEASDLKDRKGISPQALPFYAGNKFYLIYRKVYTDIRMVAAPPSAIGNFGGETDNWMWPRHTGDFSLFRVYGDTNGEPADYAAENVPLRTPKHLAISLKGFEEGDYAMIMGFPGSTSRYLTASEVKERMDATNSPRITIRGTRQEVLKEEMAKSDKVRIQYAGKYAGSSNYWKNSIGMNKAIIDNKVIEAKQEQETAFLAYARSVNSTPYSEVVGKTDAAVALTTPLLYQYTCLREVFRTGIEFGGPSILLGQLKEALVAGDEEKIEKLKKQLTTQYDILHNKDYDHEVDRKVACVLLPLYAEMVEAADRPSFYEMIREEYGGDYLAFVDHLYDNSLYSNRENFDRFISQPTVEAIDNDPGYRYRSSVKEKEDYLTEAMKPLQEELLVLHKTYIRGLNEMKAPEPAYPDANFTIRLTYGNVKSYIPRDGVRYKYYTTANGILEKEDPDNLEFNVPAKLKELILNRDFGRYAMENGELPICFLSNNDITGGNSGSPVMNGNGELIGCAFDGNWESLSGDINFDAELQRCINVDIRYILFILDKFGGCSHLIDEMTLIQ